MKHLRLFETYENIDMTGLIRAFMSVLGVEEGDFVINPDWSISSTYYIDIPSGFITKIPMKFKEVYSYFHCENNNLKTLENFPDKFTGGDEDQVADSGEIVYSGNPCWNNATQLKWIQVNSMANGSVYNYKRETLRSSLEEMATDSGWYDFVFSQKTMDDYWDEQLKKEPTLFQYLKVNERDVTNRSNQISEAFYKKHMNLFRSKNLLWHIK